MMAKRLLEKLILEDECIFLCACCRIKCHCFELYIAMSLLIKNEFLDCVLQEKELTKFAVKMSRINFYV